MGHWGGGGEKDIRTEWQNIRDTILTFDDNVKKNKKQWLFLFAQIILVPKFTTKLYHFDKQKKKSSINCAELYKQFCATKIPPRLRAQNVPLIRRSIDYFNFYIKKRQQTTHFQKQNKKCKHKYFLDKWKTKTLNNS